MVFSLEDVLDLLRHQAGSVIGVRLVALANVNPPAAYGPGAGDSPTYLLVHPITDLVLPELSHVLLAGLLGSVGGSSGDHR